MQFNDWNSLLIDNGAVPGTVISGETNDVSTVAQHGFEWVMFRDTAVSTDPNMWVLGKHLDVSLDVGMALGPSMDVGLAHCAKMLKANGADEWACEEHAKL